MDIDDYTRSLRDAINAIYQDFSDQVIDGALDKDEAIDQFHAQLSNWFKRVIAGSGWVAYKLQKLVACPESGEPLYNLFMWFDERFNDPGHVLSCEELHPEFMGEWSEKRDACF